MIVSMSSIITFTSDFGIQGHYTGEVKGAILSIAPEAKIVDISHQVGAHNLLEAAYIIAQAFRAFVPRTVHLLVVDPGVGSSRRGLVVEAEHQFFVAPDNGILSLIFAEAEVQDVISIEAEHYFRRPVSPTFHARDIFAPVAAHLSTGASPLSFGPAVTDYTRLALPRVEEIAPGVWEGFILHIDRFGNIITSIRPEKIREKAGREFAIESFRIQDKEIGRHVDHYAAGTEGELFSLVSSGGYYEIAALKKSAAAMLNARRGMKVLLKIAE